MYLDTIFTFSNHCVQASTTVSKINNVLEELARTIWGQQKETPLMAYKTLVRSIANYAAPVWSTDTIRTNIGKIQCAQNKVLRNNNNNNNCLKSNIQCIEIRVQWTVHLCGTPQTHIIYQSIDHVHSETKMLQVEDHINLLCAQYLVQCLTLENVCHHITTMDQPTGQMTETICTSAIKQCIILFKYYDIKHCIFFL